MKSTVFWALFSSACAAKIASYTGIATFNDYRSQPDTVCYGKSHAYLNQFPKGTYAAAIGDLSKDIWAGPKCQGSVDPSKCNGQSPVSGYQGPACPHGNCLKCFRVCNQGGWNKARSSGVNNCIKVQIVDACPAESAFNFCKTNIDSAQRCGTNANALDIDLPAYQALTGHPKTKGQPNLQVSIQSTSC